MLGGDRASAVLGLPRAPADKHEYGSLALTLELVESLEEAVDHIHEYGSGHTESIVTGAPSIVLECASCADADEILLGREVATHGRLLRIASNQGLMYAEDREAAEEFLRRVDSACVDHNASTRFSDGFRCGVSTKYNVRSVSACAQR